MFLVDGNDIYIHQGDSATLGLVFGDNRVLFAEGYIPDEYERTYEAWALFATNPIFDDDKLTLSLDRQYYKVAPRDVFSIDVAYSGDDEEWRLPAFYADVCRDKFTVLLDNGTFPIYQSNSELEIEQDDLYYGDPIVNIDSLPSISFEVEGDTFKVSHHKPSKDTSSSRSVMVREIYGTNWVPDDGTPIRFSVKCDTGRLKPVIQKDYEIHNGHCCIDFTPRDTRCLPFGEYVWDIRISFPNIGVTEWNTPMNPCKFTVCEVVSNGI